jgi:hypothetical protein
MLMYLMTDRKNFIAVVINSAANVPMSVHMYVCSLNAGYSLTSTEAADYPTRCGHSRL